MRIFSNTAISIDGKISHSLTNHTPLGSNIDKLKMSELRAQADAILIGGNTFRSWPLALIENEQHSMTIQEPRGKRPIYNVVLTRQGVLPINNPNRLKHPKVRWLVFGSHDVDIIGHKSIFANEVITTENPTVTWAIKELVRRECKVILVEGGGDLIYQCIREKLLQEMYITLCPLLIGGDSSPPFILGHGWKNSSPKLNLESFEIICNEVFLHYKIDY